MTRLFFSNTANQTSLSANVVASDTVLPFGIPLTGWPGSVPYKAVIEPDTASAEIVKVTAANAGSFTVLRGQDGTTAINHAAGAIIEHRWGAAEADEANLHDNSNSSVHGVTGSVVGTTDAQTLTNKTLTSPVSDTATARASSTTPALSAKAAASGTADIQQWQDSAGVRLSRVGQHGEFQIQPSDPSVNPLLIQGPAALTRANIEVRDSSGVVLYQTDSKGRLVLTPSDLSAAAIKVIPPSATVANVFRVRDNADTTDKFVLNTNGEITTAAKAYFAGSGSADVLRYPLDGSKLALDSNGNLFIDRVLTAQSVVADDVVRRVGRNTDGTTIGPAGSTELIGHSHAYPVVNGRRYRVRVMLTTTSQATVTIRQFTARVSSGTVTNVSTLIQAFQRSNNNGNPLRDDVYFEGDFVATATGTWNVALGVQTAGGAGTTNITTSEVVVYDEGI